MSAVTFTHIGGPTTLIETGGWRILTDPTFDAPGRTYRFGWGTSSRKTTGPAIPASQIGPIDVVLLTHEHHADNLDHTGRTLLPTADTVITTCSGARRLGPNARGLRNWQSARLEGNGRPTISVTATPCRHGPPGSHPVVGDVIGFALTWEGQEHGAVWISGDTVLCHGIRTIADRVDVRAGRTSDKGGARSKTRWPPHRPTLPAASCGPRSGGPWTSPHEAVSSAVRREGR